MKKFWVVFRHGPAGTETGKAMTGLSPRQVAAEVREKYRGARIEAIKIIGEGVSVGA